MLGFRELLTQTILIPSIDPYFVLHIYIPYIPGHEIFPGGDLAETRAPEP